MNKKTFIEFGLCNAELHKSRKTTRRTATGNVSVCARLAWKHLLTEYGNGGKLNDLKHFRLVLCTVFFIFPVWSLFLTVQCDGCEKTYASRSSPECQCQWS